MLNEVSKRDGVKLIQFRKRWKRDTKDMRPHLKVEIIMEREGKWSWNLEEGS